MEIKQQTTAELTEEDVRDAIVAHLNSRGGNFKPQHVRFQGEEIGDDWHVTASASHTVPIEDRFRSDLKSGGFVASASPNSGDAKN